MASQTSIANRALGLIGEARITDFAEPSVAAERIRDVWDIARQSALRSFLWNFATKTATLTADGAYTPMEEDWTVKYPLPADCLLLFWLNGQFTSEIRSQMELRQRAIFTNQSAARIKYIFDEQLTGNWDPSFIEPFAYKLAEMVAPQFTTTTATTIQLMQAGFQQAISGLKPNAIESRPRVKTAIQGSQYLAARSWCSSVPYWWGDAPPVEYGVTFNPWNV